MRYKNYAYLNLSKVASNYKIFFKWFIGSIGVGPTNHSITAVKIMETYRDTLEVFCLIRFCVITIGVCHVFGENANQNYIFIISTQRSLILFTSTSTLKYS